MPKKKEEPGKIPNATMPDATFGVGDGRDPDELAVTEKTLNNSTVSAAKANVKDIEVVGDGDSWRLLSKASSQAEGWMKSTKAMQIPAVGCIVQVTTQQRNLDGSWSVAEALAFVPGVVVIDDVNGGRRLA